MSHVDYESKRMNTFVTCWCSRTDRATVSRLRNSFKHVNLLLNDLMKEDSEHLCEVNSVILKPWCRWNHCEAVVTPLCWQRELIELHLSGQKVMTEDVLGQGLIHQQLSRPWFPTAFVLFSPMEHFHLEVLMSTCTSGWRSITSLASPCSGRASLLDAVQRWSCYIWSAGVQCCCLTGGAAAGRPFVFVQSNQKPFAKVCLVGRHVICCQMF